MLQGSRFLLTIKRDSLYVTFCPKGHQPGSQRYNMQSSSRIWRVAANASSGLPACVSVPCASASTSALATSTVNFLRRSNRTASIRQLASGSHTSSSTSKLNSASQLTHITHSSRLRLPARHIHRNSRSLQQSTSSLSAPRSAITLRQQQKEHAYALPNKRLFSSSAGEIHFLYFFMRMHTLRTAPDIWHCAFDCSARLHGGKGRPAPGTGYVTSWTRQINIITVTKELNPSTLFPPSCYSAVSK